MATSFQPEDQHEPAKHGRSYASIIWFVVLAVLAALVLLVVVPRF